MIQSLQAYVMNPYTMQLCTLIIILIINIKLHNKLHNDSDRYSMKEYGSPNGSFYKLISYKSRVRNPDLYSFEIRCLHAVKHDELIIPKFINFLNINHKQKKKLYFKQFYYFVKLNVQYDYEL